MSHDPTPAPPSNEPLPGQSNPEDLLAERYRLQEEIGHGGVGTVYQAKDIDLGRDVALKLLHERHAKHIGVTERFVEEAQIGGQLQHPGIVPVYEIGKCADGRPFIAMKLVNGETLAARLERRKNLGDDFHRQMSVFDQICQTMAYAHSRLVVHRDLKPGNVMVGAFGEVQIVDWGFAKVLRDETSTEQTSSRQHHSKARAATPEGDIETVRSPGSGSEVGQSGSTGSESVVGSAIGTPAYMPPEQARGDVEEMDRRSDVFALGAILCEILTGEPPYVKRTDREAELLVQAAQCQLADAQQRLNDCHQPAELVALCRQCLAANRADRPSDAGAVAEAIGNHLNAVDQRAKDAEIAAAAARVRVRWTYLLAASMLLTAAVGLAAWMWIRNERADRQQELHANFMTDLRAANRWRDKAQAANNSEDRLGYFEKAITTARNATDIARQGVVSTDLQQQANELIDDLENRRETALRTHREATLLNQFNEIRVPKAERIGSKTWLQKHTVDLDRGFTKTLRDRGIDIDTLPADQVAKQLRGPRSAEMAAALDYWAMIRRARDAQNKKHKTVTEWELPGWDWRNPQHVARLLDPDDPWRNELRDCLSGRLDPKTVRRLHASADFTQLPPASVLLLAGTVSMVNGRDAALNVMRAGQRQHPQDFDLNVKLAQALERSNPPQWQEAAQYYTAALSLRPKMAVLALRLAYVTKNAGRPDLALHWYDRATQLNPKLAEAWSHMGAELARQGEKKRALNYTRRALRVAPNHPLAHWSHGEALRLAGDINAAIPFLRKAAAMRPEFTEAEVGLGEALQDLGRAKAASEVFRRITKRDKSNAQALQGLGITLHRSGDRRGAEQARKVMDGLVHKLVKRNPGNADRFADSLRRKGSHTCAAKTYAALFRRRPELCVGTRRYRAACAAVMASSGKTRDRAFATEAERRAHERHALKWLQQALADPETTKADLKHWLSEACLASTRGDDAKPEWRDLWAEVRQRAQ